MKHTTIPTIEDTFGIGQVAVARIRMEVNMDLMRDSAHRSFSTGYVEDSRRAAARETFYTARAAYDHAKAVLEFHQ